MKHSRFYIYTLSILVLISVLSIVLGVGYLTKNSTIQILDNEIKSAQQQAKNIARLAEGAFERQISKDSIARDIQMAIDKSNNLNVFLTVIDWSEKLISHPDVTRVGDQNDNEGMKPGMDKAPSAEEVYNYISSIDSKSEIFYIAPIQQSSGWIIAAHINIENIHAIQSRTKNQSYLVFSIIALIFILVVMGAIRSITSYYDAQLSLKSSQWEDGVLNLSKLNDSLESYQEKLGQLGSLPQQERSPSTAKESEKQRILTYIRNELIPVAMEDIGYIYVENTITYVIQKDGKRSTSNESLDQIYSYLDEASFFRANRQIIVAISAIDKIIKFGNSKLKIQVSPASEIDIIIGKNKAAAFKQWLEL